MFGYVMPCKMELKVRDYENSKHTIAAFVTPLKSSTVTCLGATLNYDMTFLPYY